MSNSAAGSSRRRRIALSAFLISTVVLFATITFSAGSKPAYPTVKFAHLTDVHLQPGVGFESDRMLKYSQQLLDDAVDQINAMKGVDFVIFTGDLANTPNRSDLELFAKSASRLKVPWYWTTGNHNITLGGVSRKTFMSIMNKYNAAVKPENAHYSFMKNGFLFIALDGTISWSWTAHGYFSDKELGFLDKQLAENPKAPAVIFQHFPVVYPADSKTHEITNREAYLGVLDRHPNAKALFAGHYHVAKIDKRNNMLFVTTPSLVQYPNAFRVVTMVKKPSGVTFDIKLVETRLKDVQARSRDGASDPEQAAGSEKEIKILVEP
ncbi:MAG TPA: metallophosphoesterase [bacterium]|nr:metallophosphoesterase [bacterium]